MPMAGDIYAPAEPDVLVTGGIFDESLQRGDPARAAHDPTMQANGHHARGFFALSIQRIKTVLQIVIKLIPRIKSLRAGEPMPCC